MLSNNGKIDYQIIIVLVLVSSESVIETVKAGLCTTQINYSGPSPLNRVTSAGSPSTQWEGCEVQESMDVGASVYNCRPLCFGYSVFIASLKLFWVWEMWENPTTDNRTPARNGGIIKHYKHRPPQQPVSANWVNFKEVVYNEMDLQSGASPCQSRPWGEANTQTSAGAEIEGVTGRGGMDECGKPGKFQASGGDGRPRVACQVLRHRHHAIYLRGVGYGITVP